MATVQYTKPYKSVDQLIDLLKFRGLAFDGGEDMVEIASFGPLVAEAPPQPERVASLVQVKGRRIVA